MSKRNTILLVGPMPPAVGGISTFISDLLNSDLKQEFNLISFSTNRPENKSKTPAVHNFKTILKVSPHYLFEAFISTVSNMIQFPFMLNKNKIDIVHIHTPSYWSFLENSYYVCVSKLFKKKVILHIHGGAFDKFYLKSCALLKIYIRFIMRSSDKIISLSNYWSKFFANQIGINSDSIIVIKNGVVSSKYYIGTGLKTKDIINILFIGGADFKRKGAYEVAQAIPLVIGYCTNVHFIFIGKGENDEIKNICEKSNVIKYVTFMGSVSENKKIELLNNSDIFLLPSYAEGLPISILEAMAVGLPIISTTVGAIPEVIEQGVNGYLIEPGDYKELAERLLVLINNDKTRNEIKLNNLDKISKSYDISVVLKNIRNVYNELMDLGFN